MVKANTNVEPPPLPAQKQNQQNKNRVHQRVNDEVDLRLDKFMEANPDLVKSYRELVKEDPERTVRKLALNKMFRHEDIMEGITKQMPQVQLWVNQTPGMREIIEEKIRDVNPYYRERAFVSEAKRQKNRLDFKAPSVGVKASL